MGILYIFFAALLLPKLSPAKTDKTMPVRAE